MDVNGRIAPPTTWSRKLRGLQVRRHEYSPDYQSTQSLWIAFEKAGVDIPLVGDIVPDDPESLQKIRYFHLRMEGARQHHARYSPEVASLLKEVDKLEKRVIDETTEAMETESMEVDFEDEEFDEAGDAAGEEYESTSEHSLLDQVEALGEYAKLALVQATFSTLSGNFKQQIVAKYFTGNKVT